MLTAREQLRDAHRIVVKLGTQVVTHDGVELALGRLMGLVESLARLRKAGREVVLVSSGAVGMGRRVLGLTERPRSLGLRQACAAVGQGHLMAVYTQAFTQLGVVAAQVLLTQGDLADRDRALCLRTTLMRLLGLGVIPVLNENDSVSVRELVEYQRSQEGAAAGAEVVTTFGDNDGLSARVASSLDADLLVLLTDVEGLYTANPATDPSAQLVRELSRVDDTALAMAGGGSAGGTGGMSSKLEAARLASAEGTAVLIASGAAPRVLERALAGEAVGTLVAAQRRGARWRHIAVSGRQQGALVISDGAVRALLERKASLLPVGVTAVEGDFAKGDVVEVRDGSGRVLGRGLVNYPAAACRALQGRHSEDIASVLGWRGYDALVTRDNLVLG
ncbi:glutamate 5-kinase [Aggregicoccus sp. 17bor-14]|uniref:glutamate 5-kinase n=1 Tax=Myxococcaceae TaxID=31 RepID=UPI00129C1E5D|nr:MULTISPECIES: glutamate 5-kinase [Myxococcaceae]MBF5045617.1 glutamate 5-kinase [Simulacricoccus sp. 17bor-14]MRI91354.1 glutamate 5-kinase [Aggregicoccus sp. 17bor-14]